MAPSVRCAAAAAVISMFKPCGSAADKNLPLISAVLDLSAAPLLKFFLSLLPAPASAPVKRGGRRLPHPVYNELELVSQLRVVLHCEAFFSAGAQVLQHRPAGIKQKVRLICAETYWSCAGGKITQITYLVEFHSSLSH